MLICGKAWARTQGSEFPPLCLEEPLSARAPAVERAAKVKSDLGPGPTLLHVSRECKDAMWSLPASVSFPEKWG